MSRSNSTSSTSLPSTSARLNPAPVVRAANVSCSPSEAFDIFTAEIGGWWPLPTHGIFGERSAGVVFRNGQLVETAVDGAEVVWGQVTLWAPGERLVIAWHPGREPDEASEVDVVFEPVGSGTRVIIEHRGWEIFGDDAAKRRLGYVGPNAWGYVLDHFADGAEARPDAADLTALAIAYDAFFVEAEKGGFGAAPAPGEWNADETIAHVALNDAAMVAVCQALIHGKSTRFENEICQDPTVLSSYVEAAGSTAALIERGRSTSRQVLAALRRLSDEQLATEVHCRLLHAGVPMVDRPLPWADVAIETQAAMHLPAHTSQLRNLRL